MLITATMGLFLLPVKRVSTGQQTIMSASREPRANANAISPNGETMVQEQGLALVMTVPTRTLLIQHRFRFSN